MDSRVTKVEDFMKTRLLDTLTEQITKVLKVREREVLTQGLRKGQSLCKYSSPNHLRYTCLFPTPAPVLSCPPALSLHRPTSVRTQFPVQFYGSQLSDLEQ